MRKSTLFAFTVLVMMFVAIPAFAADGSPAADHSYYWALPLGAGMAIGIAGGLCGLGQGKAIASAVEGLARNPGARAGLLTFLIIGLALIESISLYALIIAIQIMGKLK
jgi:F-type H+-transporting ATPase subunit c